ncbi:MAG: hypothetical protein ACXWXQ_04595 [Actinomycetota bacterium]
MSYTKVHVRHRDGSIESFDDMDAARPALRDGDELALVNRGGHVDRAAAVVDPSGGVTILARPRGWRPSTPMGDRPA